MPERIDAQRWIGKELDERYLIGQRLGAGGMAVVHRAKDRRLDREVAVKIMRTDVGYGEEYSERLYREARGLARLTHPHIVVVHDVGQIRGVVYLVMELLEGRDLIDTIIDRGRLGIALALKIGAQVAAALGIAHGKGIIHRDVKPDNVFLVESATGAYSKLLDFSFASLPESMGGGSLRTDRVAYGTAHYMSPEQARAQPCTERSDIYSLGIMLFETICGYLPFEGTPGELLDAHRDAPIPRLVDRCDMLPMGLSDLVEQMMSKEPRHRPASALEVAHALTSIREGWLTVLAQTAAQKARGGEVGGGAADHLEELYDAERYTTGETVEVRLPSDWFDTPPPDEDDVGDFHTDTAEVERPLFDDF